MVSNQPQITLPLENGDRLTRSEFERRYQAMPTDGENIIKSQVFPGLWLAINPLLEANLAEVLQTLQQGLITPEHQDFIA